MSFSYHIEWKTFIEAICTSIIHTGEKTLQLPLLKVCGSFLFRQSKKTRGILWSVWVFFAFLEVRRRNKYCLWEANLVFYMQIFGLMWRSINLIWKTAVLKCWLCFCLFLWWTQYNFIAPLRPPLVKMLFIVIF